MENCLITFRSVTPAQRAQALLQKEGVDCALRRTPKWMEERGCGYSLQIRRTATVRAVHLLRQNRVSFGKVYSQTEGETPEELEI